MLVRHLGLLFSTPGLAWRVIKNTEISIAAFYLRILLPLAVIPPICAWYGVTRTGWQIGSSNLVKITETSATLICLIYFAAIIIGISVIAFMVIWMSETYGNRQRFITGLKFVTYTFSPLILIGVFQLYPTLWVNFIVGLPALGYSVFLLYSGVPIILGVPKEQGFMYSSAMLAVGLIALVTLLVVMVIIWSFGFEPQFAR